MNTLLVFGDRTDPHIERVCRLVPAKVNILIMDIWAPWQPNSIESDSEFQKIVGEDSFSIQDARIWYRIKPRTVSTLHENVAFSLRERREYVNGICYLNSCLLYTSPSPRDS